MKPLAMSSDQIQQVAVLVGDFDLPQNVVADYFGVSPATITRAVRKAEDDKLLVRRQETTKLVTDQNRRAARGLLDLEGVQKWLIEEQPHRRQRLKRVCLFGGKQESSPQRRLASFGARAAVVLSKLIVESRYVGISWGRTIRAVAKALPDSPPTPSIESDPIEFVPVAGSPIDNEGSDELSASHLASEFARSFGGTSLGISAGGWIPNSFNEAQVQVIKGNRSGGPRVLGFSRSIE